jgi:hypothetical protein
MGLVLLWLGMMALMFATCWSIFTKAGEAGWKSLVPIYNGVVFLRIVGRPWWWLLWMCVPLLGLIPAVIVCLDLARVFGKGAGFGVGIALLGPIFLAILAWGGAEYQNGGAPSPMRKAA